MKFSEIPGLEKEKQVLVSSVKNNHIAHAQLFFGNSGGAAYPLALAYAQYINCENKQETDSCGKCPSCSKYQKLIHPDLHFIYPTVTISKGAEKAKSDDIRSESLIKVWREFLIKNPYSSYNDWLINLDVENKQGIINVKESRAILKKISLKSFEAEYKVVFIWMPDLMNPDAANALLKVLEEPPEKTLFLLVCYDYEKLLPTILSRTQKFQVRGFTNLEIENYLNTKITDKEVISQATLLAEGSLNDALKSIENVENNLFTFFSEWMRICFKKDFNSTIEMSETFAKLGRESQKNVLNYGIKLFRNSLLFLIKSESLVHLPSTEKLFVQKFSNVMNEEKLTSLFTIMNDSHYHIQRNANPKITFTNLSINIIKIISS